jgi:hypothetical protein
LATRQGKFLDWDGAPSSHAGNFCAVWGPLGTRLWSGCTCISVALEISGTLTVVVFSISSMQLLLFGCRDAELEWEVVARIKPLLSPGRFLELPCAGTFRQGLPSFLFPPPNRLTPGFHILYGARPSIRPRAILSSPLTMCSFPTAPTHNSKSLRSRGHSPLSWSSSLSDDEDAITPCPDVTPKAPACTQIEHAQQQQDMSPSRQSSWSSRSKSPKAGCRRSMSWRDEEGGHFDPLDGQGNTDERVDTAQLWKRMLAIQRVFGCYKSARMSAALDYGVEERIPVRKCRHSCIYSPIHTSCRVVHGFP